MDEELKRKLDELLAEAKKEKTGTKSRNGKPEKEITTEEMKELASKEILKAKAYVLIAINDNGICTSMHGNFKTELGLNLMLNELLDEKNSLKEKIQLIHDILCETLDKVDVMKEDPIYLFLKLMQKDNDKKTDN